MTKKMKKVLALLLILAMTLTTGVDGHAGKTQAAERLQIEHYKYYVYLNSDKYGTCQIETNATSGTALTWKSTKPNVASVDEKGLVTAISNGKTYIIARNTVTKQADYCELTVETLANKVVLEKKKVLKYGRYVSGKYSLSYKLLPKKSTTTVKTYTADGKEKKIDILKWSSKSNKVAKVSNGNVSAKKKGATTIKATLQNEASASCKVIVKEEKPLSKVTMHTKRSGNIITFYGTCSKEATEVSFKVPVCFSEDTKSNKYYEVLCADAKNGNFSQTLKLGTTYLDTISEGGYQWYYYGGFYKQGTVIKKIICSSKSGNHSKPVKYIMQS